MVCISVSSAAMAALLRCCGKRGREIGLYHPAAATGGEFDIPPGVALGTLGAALNRASGADRLRAEHLAFLGVGFTAHIELGGSFDFDAHGKRRRRGRSNSDRSGCGGGAAAAGA